MRPVKGLVLRLRGEPGLLRHVVSGWADGRHVYLVPRADGEVVVGATQEERADATVTAGQVLDLLRAATDLVPELGECELAETLVRHRPATPDNAPLLGAHTGGVVVAAGHHRNGVLLAPVTADLIADLVATGKSAATAGRVRTGEVRMRVIVNGAARDVDVVSVEGLVEQLTSARRGVAVAVNGEVVPRSVWPAARLRDGDRVEVLTAAQGG